MQKLREIHDDIVNKTTKQTLRSVLPCFYFQSFFATMSNPFSISVLDSWRMAVGFNGFNVFQIYRKHLRFYE